MRSFFTWTALAVPALGLVVLEELPSVPHGWSSIGKVHESTPMRLHAALYVLPEMKEFSELTKTSKEVPKHRSSGSRTRSSL